MKPFTAKDVRTGFSHGRLKRGNVGKYIWSAYYCSAMETWLINFYSVLRELTTRTDTDIETAVAELANKNLKLEGKI